ncbi:MAG TPA: hypothetical protein VGN34_24185, partial [Ktedonobacteraceae bacterium]
MDLTDSGISNEYRENLIGGKNRGSAMQIHRMMVLCIHDLRFYKISQETPRMDASGLQKRH